MNILIAKDWEQYELLDSGYGRRLERFGKYLLDRPDPSCLWRQTTPEIWKTADAKFDDGWKKGGMPDRWQMKWEDLVFHLRLTPFKHTGVFPEQVEQWKWLRARSKGLVVHGRPMRILNLFGYTGGASLVCAQQGVEVTHVDGSKPTIAWARENQELSGLSDKPIRWICEDVITYCKREVKRGMKYDGIIMDPPAFGHGPDGETWKFNESFPELLKICRHLMSDECQFFLINAYAISTSAINLGNCLGDIVTGGQLESGELVIAQTGESRQLSTGIYTRWSK